MSASFRSHFRSTPQPREPSPEIQRKQSTRIPTKSTVSSENKSKASQHVSKLAKRASRSTAPSEKTDRSAKSTSRSVPTSVTPGPDPSAVSRRRSVAQQSEHVPEPSAGSAHRLPPPPSIRTPSLVSGSSASTFDSPRSNTLKKKPSNIDTYATQKRSNTAPVEMDRATVQSRNEGYQDAFDDAVLGISMPKHRYGTYESGREWHVTRDITPAAYASSNTPSTRYTDSPFSHVPTPSSASSYSPAIMSTAARPQSPVKAKPPVTRRPSDRQDASRLTLPPVRESSTSSSASTVKASAPGKVPPRKPVPRATSSTTPAPKPVAVSRSASSARPSPQIEAVVAKKPPAVQVPPELAHLNVEPPARTSSLHKPLPPIRPSRDGTSNLSDMTDQTRVVQSDLPHLYTTYHKRTPSQDTPVSASSPGFRQRFGLSSKSSSRQPSPRVDSAISPPPSARRFARGPTPEPTQPEIRKLARKDSPAIGPAPSPSKSPRFGFFSRKSKPEVGKAIEKPRRQPTKGPAAGTGHEGYGRFGFRGRSGSTTSSADARSPSADSSVSSLQRTTVERKGSFASSGDASDLEEFLKERQRPVILRGSGSTYSNAASTSDAQPTSYMESSTSSSIDSYPKPQLLPSAMQADRVISPLKRPPVSGRLPSDSSEDDVTARYPTLAARRSYSRLSQPGGKSPIRMPPPINTSVQPNQRSMDSYETETSAWPQTDSSVSAGGGALPQMARVQSPEPDTAKPSRMWNFLQRAQASPRPKGKQRAVQTVDQTIAGHRPPSEDRVPNYAMLDHVEPVDLYEVQQMLQEQPISTEDSASEDQRTIKVVPYEQRHRSLLPSPRRPSHTYKEPVVKPKPPPPPHNLRHESSESPELLRARAAVPQPAAHMVNIPPSPVVLQTGAGIPPQRHTPDMVQVATTPDMLNAPFETPTQSHEGSPRQPRLSPIGRIPQVVSRRDRDRKLPDTSFSRPFARTQPHPSVKPPGALYNQIRELASPIESNSQPTSSTSARSDGPPGELKSSINTNPASVSTARTSIDMQVDPEFIAFTPRKGSDVTYSSSSGNASWMAPISVPALQLEDPWHEYNDLLDDMMPQKTPVSGGSSLGAPFQYSSALYDPTSPAVPTPLYFSQPPTTELPQPPRSKTVPAVLSVPQQISRFMQPSMSPLTSPHTLSDLYDDYGNRSSAQLTSKRSSLPQSALSNVSQSHRTSTPNARASMASSRYSRLSAHSRSASLPEANVRNSQSSLTPSARFRRDTQLLDIAEDDSKGQTADANLRFGALMTSKWLSFGRVLFSPAHNEMRLADDPKVLVVDGLGSDWSYYVALTYPAATVYNLGPAPTNGSTSWPGINQKPPANHKHYAHTAIRAAFPFPKGFFTAVLFRFPTVTTDEAYSACIHECKRVLRPGGHLEVVVLDLDLGNMGSRARSQVRGLKTRMQARQPKISLRNLSDILLCLIDRRGFEAVQRCVVGVPAAGRIPSSREISAHSSDDSSARNRSSDRRGTSENDVDFADLLASECNSGAENSIRSNDEGITKMVARVGRWWYTQCYESSLVATDRSIWDDPALLRECEKQGTSFKLLICHAQKPAQPKRRTKSV